jgi:Ras-related protein Rab-2A
MLLKIVMVGDQKKELLYKYLTKIFKGEYSHVRGAKCMIKDLEGTKFQIWLLSAKKPHESNRPIYYRGSVGGIVVFDVCNPQSFQEVHSWIDETWKKTGRGKIPIVIVGINISEREKASTFITDKEAREFAEKLSEKTRPEGFDVSYLPVDEQTGENIDLVFEQLGSTIKKYLEKITL